MSQYQDFVNIEVNGFDELKKKMRDLPKNIAIKCLRGALVGASGVIKREAIARAPNKTGRLKKAIYVKRLSKTGTLSERYILGVRRGRELQEKDLDAYYWHFIEFGAKPHDIVSTKKNLASSSEVFGKKVRHPGTPEKPFLRPAFENKKTEALERARAVLAKKITTFINETR